MQVFADSIDFVSLSQFMYSSRTPYYITKPSMPTPMERFTSFSKTLTMTEIEVFLKNKSPKVRGLALLAMYQLEDQKALLRYADFLGDSAVFLKSRPYKVPDLSIISGISGDAYNLSKRDMLIADIARKVLEDYMVKTGYLYFEDELPQFLRERQNLDYTLGFFMLMSIKALGHANNSNDWQSDSMVMALKARINNLPNKIDAAIYKLYIPVHDKYLFNETERLEALRFLGKQHVKEILEGTPPTKDPDLYMIRESEHSPYGYYSMCQWILKHAPVVFDKNDIGYLLERADFSTSGRDTSHMALDFIYWHIACARLDTANASQYLKDCLQLQKEDYKDNRAALYAELWHRCGQREVDTILDWFYGSYSLNKVESENTSNFIYALEDAKDTVLIKRIIADSRFQDSIRIWDIVLLAWRYNALVNERVIPDELTQSISHPYGLERLEVMMDRVLKEYPIETKKTLEKMEILKKELRKLL